MNFAAGQIDMWWPSEAGPCRLPSGRHSLSGERDVTTADDDDYPPRAQVGRYLADGFDALRRHAPPNVELAPLRR